MKLREFMAEHRRELFELCVRNLKTNAPDRSEEELADHLYDFIDEVIDQLSRAEGVEPSGPSSQHTLLAAKTGSERRRNGFRIDQVAQTYATLSVSVGELGGKADLAFDAREYRVFNDTIDKAVAAAIEQYFKEAETSHESEMSARLGFLGHELRNALASARMAFGMLERGQVGMAGRTVDIIRRGFRRMARLIDLTMSESRIAGHSAPPLHRLKVLPLLRDIESGAVLEREMSLVVTGDETVDVLADEALFTSAIGNLVQNAIKFTKDGGTVQLRAHADGEHVVIEVEDECGGLPPGEHGRLFQPFVQDHADRRGIGLGLAITRDVVMAMAGEIHVRDVPGKGCVFSVSLQPGRAEESGH